MTITEKLKSKKTRLPADYRPSLTELVKITAPIAKRSGLRILAVGGTVRDMLEGIPFGGEWDVVVLGSGNGASELAASLAREWSWREPVSFERFGTHMVMGPAGQVEVSQAGKRSTIETKGDLLYRDAATRDFTLNALYMSISTPLGTGNVDILDPTERGFADLGTGTLRTPLAPAEIFRDDPLRIMRAARLSATRGYKVHPNLGQAARALTPLLLAVSPERVRDEMNQILVGSDPAAGLDKLARWGVFNQLMPEIDSMVGFRQENPYHFPDLFRHTMRVVARAPADLVTRWAALLHDCGKPDVRVRAPGGDTFYGHEAVGADKARDLLRRLKMGRRLTDGIVTLVKLHMIHYQSKWSDRAVRRLIYRADDHLPRLLDLLTADTASLKRRAQKLRDIDELRQRADNMRALTPVPRSPLSGKQIMELLDLEPGPDVGRAKEILVEAVMEGEVGSDEESARQYLVTKWQGPVNIPG
jgi:poly(A) polymerase